MNSQHTTLLSATSLNGTQVDNLAGEHIGEILDMVIDTSKARVSYAVLSIATGFLNLGSKYFAIPMEALTVDTEDRKLILDVSKERLENSPGFDKDNWPKGPQNEFIDSVYAYYDLDRSPERFDSDYRESAYAQESIDGFDEPNYEESDRSSNRTRNEHARSEQSMNYDPKRGESSDSSTKNNENTATRNLEGVQGSRANLKYGHQDALNNDPKGREVRFENHDSVEGNNPIDRKI